MGHWDDTVAQRNDLMPVCRLANEKTIAMRRFEIESIKTLLESHRRLGVSRDKFASSMTAVEPISLIFFKCFVPSSPKIIIFGFSLQS